MTAPWFDIEEDQQPEAPARSGDSGYRWQARFVCQVTIPSYKDWFKLKWGFNAAILFDETLERQKLFLESQHTIRSDFGVEPPDDRTLVFRLIHRSGAPLLVAVAGKIRGRTRPEALEKARAFYNEIKHTFPYDYRLNPAASLEQYRYMTGNDLLDESIKTSSVALIRRMEIPVFAERQASFHQGFWRSAPRSHEQIWRLMAGSECPVLLSFSLRSTMLYEKERARLLQSAEEIARVENPHVNPRTLELLKQQHREYVERRLSPWGKFFYLQVHLASTHPLDESLFRIVGTSLAISSNGAFLPGYQVSLPALEEKASWQRKIRDLDLLFTGSSLPVPRLSEVADLEEVFAAIRLPYCPPENGFPDVTFEAGKAGS